MLSYGSPKGQEVYSRLHEETLRHCPLAEWIRQMRFKVATKKPAKKSARLCSYRVLPGLTLSTQVGFN